eukprot:CAMPEP_0177756924 /NCGR_PEP_ID=MMETSP0491_2-20121128/3371_1 /TAXON_ID=63592 /ORGANISM="Tetraselmis chuii, Strain PLY429" /LENGTH=432 /DNA_ID=CAMNT_0019272545 /DNA_START=116 /DNA_END=1414 /DNA_ORIENTATION=-
MPLCVLQVAESRSPSDTLAALPLGYGPTPSRCSLCPRPSSLYTLPSSRHARRDRLELRCKAPVSSRIKRGIASHRGTRKNSPSGRTEESSSPGLGSEVSSVVVKPSTVALCRQVLESGASVTEDVVLEALRGVTFPHNTSRRSVMPEGQRYIEAFCLGLVGSRWAQLSEDTQAAPELCRLLCAFLKGAHGPPGGDTFPFTSIQLNKAYASKRHVDANNMGYSMIIGLGDYEGGLLDVDGLGQLDVRRQWHRFDGNVPHCTTAVGGAGERFSLIFFTNSSLVHAEGGAVQELQALGFNVDTLAIGGGLEVEGEVLRRIAAADDGAQRTLVVRSLSAGVFGASDCGLPALEWHRRVRLFIREYTSSAQVAWAGLCHDGDGRPADVGYVIVRHPRVIDAVARALRKASKGRLRVEPLSPPVSAFASPSSDAESLR